MNVMTEVKQEWYSAYMHVRQGMRQDERTA